MDRVLDVVMGTFSVGIVASVLVIGVKALMIKDLEYLGEYALAVCGLSEGVDHE